MIDACRRPGQFIDPVVRVFFTLDFRVWLVRPIQNQVVGGWLWALLLRPHACSSGFRPAIVEPFSCAPRLCPRFIFCLKTSCLADTFKSVDIDRYWSISTTVRLLFTLLKEALTLGFMLVHPKGVVFLILFQLGADPSWIVVTWSWD